MTEEQFNNKSFKSHMVVIYKYAQIPLNNGKFGYNQFSKKEDCECLLIGIDFENKLFKLWVVPDSKDYEGREFWAYCTYVELPKKKMKLA
jgi:hypothetical protein